MSDTSPSPTSSALDFNLSKVLPFNLENAIAILLIALAILSRFYGLGDRAMSHDEVNHVVPSYDFSQGSGYNYDPMTHGPLQFHLIAASFILFGDNDFTARIPVALFSIATVAFVLFAYRRYLGRFGAMAAGFMFLISPFMLFYGRYARNEAFIVLWAVITLYAMLRYLERGTFGDLMLFVLVNAFHFIDKSTAYIFAAEELLFLGSYLLYRLMRNEQFRSALSLRNLIIFAGGMLFLSGGIFMLRSVDADAALTARLPGLLFGGCGLIAIGFSLVALLQDAGAEHLRKERSFDLLVMLGTLVLPLLAALPMSMAGVNIADVTSNQGALTAFAFILALAIPAILIGAWWNVRVWAVATLSFFFIFALFYTTFLTNLPGLPSGMVRALGYWMEQQGVQRGSQPWYLYLLVEIPVYEYLPFLGMILALFIGIKRKLWSAPSGKPFLPSAAAAEGETTVPTLALLIFWSLAQLFAFSYAGEKMGWLTIHIAAPMILACGWAIGYLIEKTIHFPALQEEGQNWLVGGLKYIWFSLPGMVLTILGFLAVFTARTAIQAAYYNYDYPFEYMVYAHGAPAPKQIFQEIEQVSFRATGDRNLVVAYDNNVRYPYWWYLRHFPNRIDFNETPTSNIRNAAYILVGEANRTKVQPFLKGNYVEFRLPRLWWPNEDYKGLKWEDVESEYARNKADAGVPNPPKMNVFDYLAICWERVNPMFLDKQTRSAVFDVWVNRDFGKWSRLQNRGGYTLGDWSIADWMYVYIRKDYLGGLDGKGTLDGALNQPDQYALATISMMPDLTLGGIGNQPGQFMAPHGIATAPDGSLYIADSYNHRIQHVSISGQVIASWGAKSMPNQLPPPTGTFNEPWGIAVGPDGSVYVADTWNNRIQKFTAEGEFIIAWGSGGQAKDGPDRFYGPRAVAVGPDGKVYVADTGNKRIVVFSANGEYLAQIGEEGADTGQLNEPVGVAVDDRGRVYVADTWNSRVQIFAPAPSGGYTVLAAWDVDGWYGQDPANKPYLAVDSAYHVFLTDPTTCRVMEFSQAGAILALWGECGEGAGQIGMPTGITWSATSGLWVTDSKANTLLHFTLPPTLTAGEIPALQSDPVEEATVATIATVATLATVAPSPTEATNTAFISIKDNQLYLKGHLFPAKPKIADFQTALGESSRVDKKEAGTIYVYDDLGISFRTDVGKQDVSELTMYCVDASAAYSFASKQLFSLPFEIQGRKFPLGKPISEVMLAIPEIKKDPKGFGALYSAIFGDKFLKLVLQVDKNGIIQTIGIDFQGSFSS
jgi:predicted membrane-bound mannosyltransferase/streptogramin lyase